MNRIKLLLIFLANLSFLSNVSAETLISKENGQERPPEILEVDGIRHYFFENGTTEQEDEGKSLNRRAIEQQQKGHLTEAIAFAKRALEWSEKTYGKEHPNVAADLMVLGGLYEQQGDLFNAEPLLQRAVKVDSEIYGAEHPEVGVDLVNLGLFYKKKGDAKNAEEIYNKALGLLTKAQDPKYSGHLAVCHQNLGQLKLEQKDLTNGLAHLKSAADLYEQTNPSAALEVLNKMATIYVEHGDHLNAEKMLSRAKAIMQD